MDPDPDTGGPKTYGSGTLHKNILKGEVLLTVSSTITKSSDHRQLIWLELTETEMCTFEDGAQI